MAESLDSELVWDEYILLEENFLECLRYVPLFREHFNVWSLNFGDLLIRTCSIIDSFFKRAMFSSELDNADNITYYRTFDDRQININTHRLIFESFYGLSSKKIYENRKLNSYIPFSNWNSNDSPDWWTAYNHVKHDRFKNKTEATLEVTINALSALFILNVIHLETMPVLVDYSIIKSNLAKGELKRILSQKEPLKEMETVYAKTKLFGYVFESTESEPDVKWILSHSYPGY